MFDSSGGLVANAPHLPVHLGAMQEAVRYGAVRCCAVCMCMCLYCDNGKEEKKRKSVILLSKWKCRSVFLCMYLFHVDAVQDPAGSEKVRPCSVRLILVRSR